VDRNSLFMAFRGMEYSSRNRKHYPGRTGKLGKTMIPMLHLRRVSLSSETCIEVFRERGSEGMN
jgi:hypothetical protein